MPWGGARAGAGRKAQDRPDEPLLTYSFTVRLTDLGVLNRLGEGNMSLGLRRLIDRAGTQALHDAAKSRNDGPRLRRSAGRVEDASTKGC